MKNKYFPNHKDFLHLSKTEKLIPVFTKFLWKKDDPGAIYSKLQLKDKSFLLDSGNSLCKTARWSFIGASPSLVLKSRGNRFEVIHNPGNSGKRKSEIFHDDPLVIFQKIFSGYKIKPNYKLPPFFGGAVGFFSYDLVHFFEYLPETTIDDAKSYDLYFIMVMTVVAIDHKKKQIWIITNVESDSKNHKEAYRKGINIINNLKAKITHEKIDNTQPGQKIDLGFIRSNYDFEEYKRIVKKVKEYIKSGDIYQANLSQRFKARAKKVNPFFLYQRLREINPSPFACFLDFPEVKIISSSPERLIKVSGRIVETRPIAGTKPRGKDKSGDKKMEKELFLSDKERAEHIMLVDLERNDLGRVCKYNSVKVDELMVAEKYSHVIHIVSNVKGKLQKGRDAFDCIRACFPGGTITGVPKVRCMEIIDELEKHRRGPYTGSAGYICFNGDIDLNILIRTFVLKDNYLYFQAGGGIVADSIPEKEYEETLHKAEALFQALGVSGVGGRKIEAGGRKIEAGGRKIEAGGRKLEARNLKYLNPASSI